MNKILFYFMILSILCISAGAQNVKIKVQKSPKTPCTTLLGKTLFTPVDTTPSRQVADNYKTWENGDVIKVKFIKGAGSLNMRTMVMQAAKEWEKYANVTFQFVSDAEPATNIRIYLGSYLDELGHNSSVGIDCNYISQDQQTLNLDTTDFYDRDYYVKDINSRGPFFNYIISQGAKDPYTGMDLLRDVTNYPVAVKMYNQKRLRGVTQHEFGHALGLLHEQGYPGAIHWNKDTVYKYYSKYQHWDKKTVDFNVFEAYDKFYTNGTTYDPLSIMQYSIEPWQTTDGYSVEESLMMSDGDKKLIAALYPKNQKVSNLAVPKVSTSNFTRLDVKGDATRKGLVIRPAFDVKTGAVLANTYFIAYLTTEDGKFYIPTSKEQYNVNGNAATYLKKILLPNTSASYNKGSNNLELFFPYDQMPALNGKKVSVLFAIYLDDTKNNRVERVSSVLSNATTVAQ